MEGWCFLFGDGASRGHNSSNNKANASTSAESVASAETVYYRRGGEAGKEKRAIPNAALLCLLFTDECY